MARWLRAGGVMLLCLLCCPLPTWAADVKLPAQVSPDAPEPPPAPLLDEEPPPTEVEPDPGPLRDDTAQANLLAQRAALAGQHRFYGATGYVGAAFTVGLVVSGVTLGLLTQSRSDELSRFTVQSDNGLPPLYDAAQRDSYERLQLEGQTFQKATIACFTIAGVTAIGTGLLFWKQSRIESAQKKLAILPTGSANHVALAVIGRW